VPTGGCGGESVCAGVGINLGLLYVKEPSVPNETETLGVFFALGVWFVLQTNRII